MGGLLVTVGSFISLIVFAAKLAVKLGLLAVSEATLGFLSSLAFWFGVAGAVLFVAVLILGFFLGWFNPTVDTNAIRSQMGPLVTNLFRIRENLNTLNTTQLQQNSQQATAFAGYASDYANEAAGKYRTELLKARLYFTRVSQAYATYKTAAEQARQQIDTLIQTCLHYTASTGETITAHLIGVNATAATYNTTAKTFTVNAAITPNGNQFTKKTVTADNLDGTVGSMSYSEWQSWAGDPPVEHDNENREFKVYYRTDTQKIRVIGDPDSYDQSPYWTVSNVTYFQYKYYLDCSPSCKTVEEWLNTINNLEPTQKLQALEDASNNLTSVITHTHPDKLPPPPTIIGPTQACYDVARYIPTDYALTTTNPDNENLTYIIDWGDGTRTITNPHEPSKAAITQHTWNSPGTYQIKAAAIDQNGAWTGWSTPHTITIHENTLIPNPWYEPSERDQTLWVTGYCATPTSFNPLLADYGQGFDTYIMYEPLFGVDRASNRLIKWLGESIEWNTDGTVLTVKLRNGVYWVKIADWTGWLAGVCTPEKYRQINTTDVKYSFMLYNQHVGLDSFVNALKNGWDSFITADATTLIIRLKPEYAYSQTVWQTLTRSYLIVPFDIWQQIPNPAEFTNDWTKLDFPAGWRVASGMYLPWKHDANKSPAYTIMQINWWWWGIRTFERMPAPHYIGYLNYYSTYTLTQHLKEGKVDWCGVYIPNIGEILAQGSHLHTYLDDPPYYCQGDWYIYNIQYWGRWPSWHRILLPCSPYGGSSQTANLHFILLALGSSHTYGLQDINNDHIVDMKDIRAAAAAFLAEPGDLNWDFPCDVTGGNLIDMKDIRNIAAFFLCEWSFSDP